MSQEDKNIHKCLREIEERLDWGPSETWHNNMFLELSERIQQKTKVLLSPVTLKRVWGRIDYKGTPSITTLNTLAQFVGYKNWRDFKGKTTKQRSWRISKKIGSNLGIIMLSASVMTLIFISFYSLRSPNDPQPQIDTSKVIFKSKPIAKGLPNSVVFDLDLSEISSDSIHIQQYWDPTKTITLKPDQKQATGQYYFPGYFRAKLLVDGQIIKEHDLFIKSDGWLGTLDYRPIPKYVPSPKDKSNGLVFPKTILEEVKENEKPLNTTFHMVRDFETISGDNFELLSAFRNTYQEKWAVCQRTSIVILGTKGAMIIPFSIPGCTSELRLMMNDVSINGKEHDLSKLGMDMSQTKEVKVIVKNKTVSVLFGEEELFNGDYHETMGRIAGVRYRFLGAGEVHKSTLQDLEGETIINFLEDFNEQ